MTFNAKLVAYGVGALVLTAVVDVISGLGPLVFMCAYAGFIAAWAIGPEAGTARTTVDLKKAA